MSDPSHLFYTLLNWRLIVCMFRVMLPQSSSSYIVKLTLSNVSSLSLPPFLFSFCGAFIRLLFRTPHCVQAIILHPSLYSGPALQLSVHVYDDWKFSKEMENLELISSQIFCLQSHFNVQKQMKWCQTKAGMWLRWTLFSAYHKTRYTNMVSGCMFLGFL